jgi:transcription termination factor Rho
MSADELKDLHLADLHAKAAEVGVNGYRMLSREELIAEIEAGGKKKRSRWPRRKAPKVDAEAGTDELKVVEETEAAADEPDDEPEPKPRRRGRRGGRGRGGGDRERLGDDAPGDEETEEITGVLEITRQRHGFLAVEGSDDDVYVSASQVRRCELSDGDEVTGPVRAPRRGERHRALVRVNLVNGEEPVEAPSPKPKSGGDGRSGSRASKTSIEVKLIAVEGAQATVEIAGAEHTLEQGESQTVEI